MACRKEPVILSDFRRQNLGQYVPALYEKWLSSPKSKQDAGAKDEFIALLERKLEDSDEEGLDVFKGTYFHYIAMAYAALGDEENWGKWAEAALPYCKIHRRREAFMDTTEAWVKAMKDPRKMSIWGQRFAAK